MNIFILTIAGIASLFSADSEYNVERIVKSSPQAIEAFLQRIAEHESARLENQILENGMLQMDRYERFLPNPDLTLQRQQIG